MSTSLRRHYPHQVRGVSARRRAGLSAVCAGAQSGLPRLPAVSLSPFRPDGVCPAIGIRMPRPMPEQPFLPFDEPEPRPSEASTPRPTVVCSLAKFCRDRSLDEKVLVAPSLAIGHTILERLGREGGPWVNLRVETARTLALGVVAADLAREGLRLLSRAQALALVEQACAAFLTPKAYFGPLRDRPGFHRALQRTF